MLAIDTADPLVVLQHVTRDPVRAQLLHQRSISFVRLLSVLHTQDWPGLPHGLEKDFARRFPRDASRDEIGTWIQKAATAPGTSTDATWAGPLAAVQPLATAFLAYVRAASVLSRLQTTSVPFNASLPAQTAGGTFNWVGEAKVKPVTSFGFGTVIVTVAKANGIIVVTDELLRLAMPGTEQFLRDSLANGVAEFVDQQFLNPAVAAVGGVNPGSITNGISAQAPSGTTAAALRSDVDKLLGAFFQANANATAAALIMAPQYVAMLAGVSNSPTLTLQGGTYSGVPVVPSASAATAIVVVDASAILVASGGIQIDATRNALLQMDAAPTDPPVAATVPISLWQENLTAMRAEYWISWTRGRSAAVKYISPCAYTPGT